MAAAPRWAHQIVDDVVVGACICFVRSAALRRHARQLFGERCRLARLLLRFGPQAADCGVWALAALQIGQLVLLHPLEYG